MASESVEASWLSQGGIWSVKWFICSLQCYLLLFQVGDIILVTAMHKNGQWEGELRGKTGHFPFTHVEFLDSGDEEDEP